VPSQNVAAHGRQQDGHFGPFWIFFWRGRGGKGLVGFIYIKAWFDVCF
jgi:hypothetical protein